ncbi:MAG TPA: 6,7-dimethyl-8-ribityllumazine synthase [Longimicrobiales bacterium]|nr:6,7-dimethyl-8-ribityllumazine synthase [Longimicrobiales bacterium]
MREIKGQPGVNGRRFAIIVSRFNEAVTGRLLAGARACLKEHGARKDDVDIFSVPGAWELPVAALHAAQNGYAAVIAIGCVIRGDTPHFDYVAGGAAQGLADVSVRTGVPVVFGVLTTDNAEQAFDRAGGKDGNKGWEAAHTAMEMADLIGKMREERAGTE